jgi:hypothetical protein
MPRVLLSAIMVALSIVSTSFAQERPDLTGTWRSEATGPEATTLVITDTPALLTIERTTASGPTERLTFAFIGESEARERFGASHDEVGGPTLVEQTKASWHDGHLDTFIVRLINGKTVTQNIIYTMDPGGSRMTVQQGLLVHHGYEGLQQRDDNNTVTEVYVRR